MNGTASRGGRGLGRRRFLGAAATALAAPLVLPARVLGRGGITAPNDRIGIGVIGLGDRGPAHIRGLLPVAPVRIAAVCDVFRSKAEKIKGLVDGHYGAAAGAGCAAVQDYREVLARDDVDAVIITAPENWHAKMSIDAMRAGRDVYCEKALTLTVAEGRAVCEAVKRTGRVFQAGTQQRSDRNFRFACELARNGYLGRVHTAWVGVPGGRALGVLPAAPVPEDLNYDLWLGPAVFKPYRDGLCTYNWYFASDYCAGWIQSWGVHHVDIALWGAPALAASKLEVEGTATFPDEGDGDVSYAWHTRLREPGGVLLDFCSDGEAKHGHGVRFEGDKGWVHVVRGGIRAEPASLLETVLKPADERLYVSREHQLNFLECIRTRREPVAPAEACHRATTATLVADIATRTGRPMVWNWAAERFENDDAANRMLSRGYRSPWTL